jgi:hypothetical protein
MSPALRHPNGPAFDTNALQIPSSAWSVGRLGQAAPYFALRATKGKREAESKGEVREKKSKRWPGSWTFCPDVFHRSRVASPTRGWSWKQQT